MTTRSRVVLQDVRFAIEAHTDVLQTEEFRISWIAIVAMLRAIGHVLDKVDSNMSPAMKSAIAAKWAETLRTKPDPKIFWEFIVGERNRFLKN